MGPIRSLVARIAAVVVAGSLAGCAAGLHDETSRERSTPYLGSAVVGGLKVRDVAVIPADTGIVSSPSTGSDTGQTQGALTMVVVNDGSGVDNITNIQVGDGGSVTPTDATASGTVEPGRSLIFGSNSSDLSISGLSSPLVPGTTIKVTVTFQIAGQVVVQAPVLTAPGS